VVVVKAEPVEDRIASGRMDETHRGLVHVYRLHQQFSKTGQLRGMPLFDLLNNFDDNSISSLVFYLIRLLFACTESLRAEIVEWSLLEQAHLR